MKKTVLTFGLIPGIIMSVVMFSTFPFMDKIGFRTGEIIGWTSIVLSFTLIFFGVRSYRENIGQGAITFGRAFKVGILIALLASLIYTLLWLIVYFGIMPEEAKQQFQDMYLQQMQQSGASQDEIEKGRKMMQMLKNPFLNGIMVFLMEPFPVGLVITLISAAVLRKKPLPSAG